VSRSLLEGRSFHEKRARLSDGRESSMWDACPTALPRRRLTVCDHETPGPPRMRMGYHGSHDDPQRLAEDLPTSDGPAMPPLTPGERKRGITSSPVGTTA
jgi:hypothetical protein